MAGEENSAALKYLSWNFVVNFAYIIHSLFNLFPLFCLLYYCFIILAIDPFRDVKLVSAESQESTLELIQGREGVDAEAVHKIGIPKSEE